MAGHAWLEDCLFLGRMAEQEMGGRLRARSTAAVLTHSAEMAGLAAVLPEQGSIEMQSLAPVNPAPARESTC